MTPARLSEARGRVIRSLFDGERDRVARGEAPSLQAIHTASLKVVPELLDALLSANARVLELEGALGRIRASSRRLVKKALHIAVRGAVCCKNPGRWPSSVLDDAAVEIERQILIDIEGGAK